MTNPLVLILQNHATTWVSRRKEENKRKLTPLTFDLNKKQKSISFTVFCLQVVPTPWTKA